MKQGCSTVVHADNRSNNPVANGSRVPAWPVRAPVRRRSSATSANDDGPAGLSASTMPAGSSARGTMKLLRASARAAGPRGSPAVHGSGRLVHLCVFTADELGDVVDRGGAREAGRLTVAAAARLARDRGHVDLVGRGAEGNAARRPVRAW